MTDATLVTATNAPSTGTSRPAPAVVVEGVRKQYGSVTAVDGLSLTIMRGEFFGILGPNGAGKTTLLEIVEGLRRADAGSVQVLGRSPWPRDLTLLRQLGVQTQASSFFPGLSALEHLTTVAALYGVSRPIAAATLKRFGLWDKRDVRVQKLSGGQQRRLSIAAAVVHEPEVIFLDEPTAALDPQARRELWGLLDDLHHSGHTVVYTTHYMDEAQRLCDRVAIIDDGKIVAEGTPQELIRLHAGPYVQIVVDRSHLDAVTARAVEGVHDAREEGASIVIETARPEIVMPAIGNAVGYDNVSTRGTSLEDVYLELTGKEYSA
ncbi:MAG: ABC transporter ATP-binding protein [Humibacillus sp.]|nr:ABC transporter ATP-binding protein [Humibacillus sp.]MDN5775871.1 ABC transporter ATP-binding protein [Humibacillus sp.]